jgi:spore coat protein CotF
MASIISNMVQGTTDINDEVIASDMLAGAKGGANAYLNAALMAPTPELRAMYSSNLSQVLSGYNALADLAIKRGWEKPYDDPKHQLVEVYAKSKTTVES